MKTPLLALALVASAAPSLAQKIRTDSTIDGFHAGTLSSAYAVAEGYCDSGTRVLDVTLTIYNQGALSGPVTSVLVRESASSATVLSLTASSASIYSGSTTLTSPQYDMFRNHDLYYGVYTGGLSAELTGVLRLPTTAMARPTPTGLPFPPMIVSKGEFDYDPDGPSNDVEYAVEMTGGPESATAAQATLRKGPGGQIMYTLNPSGPGTWDGVLVGVDLDFVTDYMTGALVLEIDTGGTGSPLVGALRSGELNGNNDAVSFKNGGNQNLRVDLGPDYGGHLFLVLGTLSGTTPGIPLSPDDLPLNIDPYFDLTLSNPNAVPLPVSFGALDPIGRANAKFYLPPGFPPHQYTAHHAAVVFDPITAEIVRITNAVALEIQP